ncbi:MAG: cysteine methyltransferase [Thermoprotei archaeon]|nr:MAG: cysteine methyltransferase [Thermoprotei archaeon]
MGYELLILKKGKVKETSWNDIKEAIYMLVQLVPIGKVVSYSAIAKVLGISPRTVARALVQNPMPIIVPCHRVIMKNRNLGGYTPRNPQFKRKLLEIEGVAFENSKVSRTSIYDKELWHKLDLSL